MALLSEKLRLQPANPPVRFAPNSEKVTPLVRPRNRARETAPADAAETAQWLDSVWPAPVTVNDLREVVRLLRKHPDGLQTVELNDPFRKRILDPAKLTVYRDLQLITQHDSLIRLAPRGQALVAELAPEAEHFRRLLSQLAPYRAALEWLHQQAIQRATDNDLADFWREQQPLKCNGDVRTLKAKAISFFHLCHAADFGVLTLGKRGQPARLRVDQQELSDYLQGARQGTRARAAAVPEKLCVAISTADHSPLVRQIQTALGLADIESVVIANEPAARSSLNGTAWRRCTAGLLIVAGTEQADGALAENVWLRLGAASALYADHCLLLWEKPLPFPDRLAHWRYCEFNGEGLTWELGARLVQAIKEFRQ
ncbi:MAG: hypothetical protein HOP19_11115 [Acidobacteria bacterium]|nr:hypothetical protein [Acidobacteriota bacterium]